ncbi:MAG: hypothetical protein AAF196_05875 [Planctomycetota bacterium]
MEVREETVTATWSKALGRVGFGAIAWHGLHGSFAPYVVAPSWANAWRRLLEGAQYPSCDSLRQILLWGALAGCLQLAGWADKRRIGWLVVGALFIEIGQTAFASRHPRVADLVAAVAGVAVGLLAARFILSFRQSRALTFDSARSLVWIGFIGLTAVGFWRIDRAFSGSDLRDWDPRMPMVVANSPNGLKPFFGEVGQVRWFGRALTDDQIRESVEDPEVELPTLLSFDLRAEPGVELPVSFLAAEPLDGPELRRQGGKGRSTTMGWMPGRRGLVYATEPLTVLEQRARSAGEFTVSVECRSTDRSARGGRVFGITEGEYRRNLEWIQRGPDLEIRVRCGLTGPSGHKRAIVFDDVFADQEPKTLTMRFVRGDVSLFVDGEPYGEPVGLLDERLVREFGTGLRSVFIAAAWFLPLSWFGVLVARTRRKGAPRGTALAISVLLILLSGQLSAGRADRDLPIDFVLSSVVLTLIGATLASRSRLLPRGVHDLS